KTQKGKGHGPSQADSANGGIIKGSKVTNNDFLKSEKDKKPPYFACKALIEAAHLDPKIILISHSLTNQKSPFLAFRDLFPERYIDAGVSEGHAISLSYVLAAQGYKPYVILYSNMLQRVLDQALIDACLQRYPIRFIIDHSSIVFHNVQHAGFFDTAFLGTLPNLLLMSPSSQESVTDIIQFSAQELPSPCVIRLSKELWSLDIPHPPVEMAKGHYIQHGTKVGILSYGSVLKECIDATKLLEAHGISTTLADARFMQPIDEKMVFQMAKKHDVFVSVEENSSGGLSSQVLRVVCKMGLLNDQFHYYPIFLKQIQGINQPPVVVTPEQIFHTIQTLLSF
ncbi:MAG: transketolase C-terminal domain-containing protein, partial [Alphaproteobacteria bacterium]|nr:transketolase C-terminal domain-containing protein [Alphaproteobacteria bacterium]